MVKPGTILDAKDVCVGQIVQAIDRRNKWVNGVVEKKSGRGSKATFIVRFDGWAEKWNEKYTARMKKVRVPKSPKKTAIDNDKLAWGDDLRGRLEDGTYIAEKVVAIRRRGGKYTYRIRWEGWGADDDTWEKTAPRECIDEFYQERDAEEEVRRNPPKAPPVPFTAALAALESPETKAMRLADAADVLIDVGREIESRTRRQKSASNEVKFYHKMLVGGGAFHALRGAALSLAQAHLVTEITSLRRGARPVDQFVIYDDELINTIVGDDVMRIHVMNGAAVKPIVPLTFQCCGRRDAAGELLPGPMELKAKVHYAALVPDHANPQAPLFRLDDGEGGFEYDENDRHAYKQAVAAEIMKLPIGAVSLGFRHWASNVLA